jgi:hypothetical protein
MKNLNNRLNKHPEIKLKKQQKIASKALLDSHQLFLKHQKDQPRVVVRNNKTRALSTSHSKIKEKLLKLRILKIGVEVIQRTKLVLYHLKQRMLEKQIFNLKMLNKCR